MPVAEAGVIKLEKTLIQFAEWAVRQVKVQPGSHEEKGRVSSSRTLLLQQDKAEPLIALRRTG